MALYPGGPFKKKAAGGARAAHTVVTDEVGCPILWTNINVRDGRYRETQVNQPQTFLRKDPQTRARERAAIFVARRVVEKVIDPTVEFVSQQDDS